MLRNWQNTGGAGTGAIGPSFAADLQAGLTARASGGDGTPTFTRATVAYQQDFEGKYNAVLSGEARFQGARRVANLFGGSSENFTNVAWNLIGATLTAGQSDPFGGTAAYRLLVTGTNYVLYETGLEGGIAPTNRTFNTVWYVKSNTGATQTFRLGLTATGTADYFSPDLTATTSWKRFNWIKAFGGADITVVLSGIAADTAGTDVDLLIYGAFAEDVTGQANQNPGPYRSVGVLSAPYYGAGVDGVSYENTLNGNTVASNVVTEATGAAIVAGASGVLATAPVDAGGPFGYCPEFAATQIIAATADIRDMTTASWTLGATMTRAKTSVGADGVANSATRLTGGAVAATNIITYLVTAAASTRTYSCLMKRVTGTGTILLTQLGATSDITSQLVAGQWVLVQFASSQLNATIGVQINTNLDAVDVDFNLFEAGGFATSRIATGGATRNVDVLTYSFVGNANATSGAVYAELSTAWSAAVTFSMIAVGFDTDANRQNPLYEPNTGIPTQIFSDDGTNTPGISSLTNMFGAVRKRMMTYSAAGGIYITGDGAAPVTSAFDGNFGSVAIGVGNSANGLNQWCGTIRNVRIYPKTLSASQLQAMTT